MRLGQVGVLSDRLRTARFCNLCAIRAQIGTKPHSTRLWVFAAFEKPRRFKRLVLRAVGRGVDLASVRCSASQPIARIGQVADQRACLSVICVIVSDASCLIDLRKGGFCLASFVILPIDS